MIRCGVEYELETNKERPEFGSLRGDEGVPSRTFASILAEITKEIRDDGLLSGCLVEP